ncbi:hypothetical protein AYI68_g7938 [Smittium mucronatum]|uniref:Uncharacterized protein n=1 Tax=Smittium mucronatum TaxID=133383 RepID=A0A1R0GMB5_9FUNG|nr:hypothetical protein AYI68_g7938 [Smittium mucronatum]
MGCAKKVSDVNVGSGFSIPVRPGRYCSHTLPIYTSPVSSCTDNTKCLYSPQVSNNRIEIYWRGVGLEPNESSSKENTRSSITGSPAKSTDGYRCSLSSRASIEIDAKASLSLSSATSHQASNSGVNP